MLNDQFNYLSSGGHWRTINLAEGLSYLKYLMFQISYKNTIIIL
jgi:hypothetical protein